jgi:hypothetical protein
MSTNASSSTGWFKWGALGCGVLSVACCGLCGGATFFGARLTEEQTCTALAEHPAVTALVGAQLSCEIAWDSLGQSASDADTLPYRVVGAQAPALLDVTTESLGADAEQITRVVVIQTDGTRVPLDDVVGGGGAAVPPAGATVRIVEIAEDDAYYGDRGTLVNRRCTVGDDVQASSAGGGWLAGTFQCGGTDNPYFYKVKVE